MSVDSEIRKTIRQIVREEMRTKVNPTPGGPFHTVYVNPQGQVIRAEAGGGGATLLAIARGSTQNVPNDNGAGDYDTTRLQFDTVIYDPQSTITTGASWLFTPPVADALYAVCATVQVDSGSNSWAAGDYAFLTHRAPSDGDNIDFWTAQATHSHGEFFLHCVYQTFSETVLSTYWMDINLLRTGTGGTTTQVKGTEISFWQVT